MEEPREGPFRKDPLARRSTKHPEKRGQFVVAVRLEDGEAVVVRCWANRVEPETIAGGRLVLTTDRLLYRPHLVARIGGATSLDVSRSEIVAVGVAPPGEGIAFRRTLRISLRDGSTEHFVVNRVDRLNKMLWRELSLAG